MLKKFFKLKWHQDGVRLTSKEKKSIIESLSEKRYFLSKFTSQSLVLIQEANPLVLTILFLDALDKKLCPILLSPNYTTYQCEKILGNTNAAGYILSNKLLYLHKKSINYKNCYGVITSGTTGTPKLYYLPINGVFKIAESHANSLDIKKKSTLVQALPVYHSFGIMTYIFTAMIKGCGIDFYKQQFDISNIDNADYNHGILYLSPSLAQLYCLRKINPKSKISSVSVGGGLIDLKTMLALQKFFPKADMFVTYGLTEAGPRLTTNKLSKNSKNYSIGKPLDGTKICIFDNKTNTFQKTGYGILSFKSPAAAINLGKRNKNEYFKTRDYVKIDKNREIIFYSREEDIINIGGVSVYCKDIESVAQEMGGVSDSFVYSEKNTVYGEIPILAIEGNVSVVDVFKFLKDKLMPIQMPKKIYILKKFDRSSLLKVDRDKLKHKIKKIDK